MSALPADDRLIDVPDVGAVLKRDWPRLLNRALVAMLVPLAGASLMSAMGALQIFDRFTPPRIWFLVPASEAGYLWRVIAFLILVLVLGAFLLRERRGGAIVAIAVGISVAAAFNHSALHWTELFQFTADGGSYIREQPPAAAWAWGILLFAAVGVFLLVEATFDTRRQQEERGLADEETRDVARVARQGVAMAVLVALGVGAALFGASAWLGPLARDQLLANRLNPVVLLLVLGVALALAVVLAARRARVAAQRTEERSVRVPVQGPARR